MRSASMAIVAPKALCQVWRYLQRSIHDAAKFKGALGTHLDVLPHCCTHTRHLVEASYSQFRPWVFHSDLMWEQWHRNLKNHNDKDRPQLEQIRPPEPQKVTVEDSRKLLSLVRLEVFKKSLRRLPKDCISHIELLQVCMESVEQCSEDEAVAFVRLLDEAGHILVIGHTVHLSPNKVARALEDVMQLSSSPNDELARLEKHKAEIDHEAEKWAKTDLWCGLGVFSVKTTLLMRWTFWELSWDVMEPVCFFLTSVYIIAGYAFFLWTSTAPTFEGFFKARYTARQKQLMRKRNFDHGRFIDLHMLSAPRFKCINYYN